MRRILDVDTRRLDYAQRILGAIKWDGVAGVSFIVSPDHEHSWYIETNGRFWASVQGSVNAGWDFPYWAARYFLHNEVPVPPMSTSRKTVTCYHTEDLAMLIRYLAGGPSSSSVTKPGALTAVWGYLRAFGPGYQPDVFQWYDPSPAIVDHMELASRALRRLMQRTGQKNAIAWVPDWRCRETWGSL
jgi:predicted ATP-grasp superfamily ATP-dependent carboligase